MEEATEITKKVTTVMRNFQPRFDRQDTDFDRWAMKRVGARGSFESQTSVKDRTRDTDIEIVSNDFRTFSDDVQSILSSSERQIRVRMAELEGEDKREEMGKLERLLEFAFEKADERLINLLMGTLKENLVWYSIVRGWVSARFLVYKVDKEVVFDFLPYDPRWLAFQVGANDLAWSGYTTSLTVDNVREQYGKAGAEATSGTWWKPFEKVPDTVDRIDYWKDEGDGKKSNAIICNNKFLKNTVTYDMKSMPVLIAPVATRPPIRGKMETEMAGYGESIFASNRHIGDLLDKLASMWASHANLLYKQPTINYYGEDGVQLKTTAYLADGVLNLPMNKNRLEDAPMKEISPTLVNLVNWAERKRVRGSLPDIDVGSPPPSGTLYNLVQETSNRVYNPQLRNLNSFYSNAGRLVEEQLIAGGVTSDKKNRITKVKLEGEIKDKFYSVEVTPVDLKKPHIIKVEFTARTPWQQLDTWQIADMAKRQGLPDSWIHENILKLQDPKYISSLSAMELADHSPKLAMLASIEAFMKYGQEEKATQLMGDMFNMERQENAQTQTAENAAVPQLPEGEQTEPTPPGVV